MQLATEKYIIYIFFSGSKCNKMVKIARISINGNKILEITSANFSMLCEVIDFHVTQHVTHAATRIHYIFD